MPLSNTGLIEVYPIENGEDDPESSSQRWTYYATCSYALINKLLQERKSHSAFQRNLFKHQYNFSAIEQRI